MERNEKKMALLSTYYDYRSYNEELRGRLDFTTNVIGFLSILPFMNVLLRLIIVFLTRKTVTIKGTVFTLLTFLVTAAISRVITTLTKKLTGELLKHILRLKN